MSVSAFSGRSLNKNSRAYIDPMVDNGKVKIIKKADPKKLEELKKSGWNMSKKRAIQRMDRIIFAPRDEKQLKMMKKFISL